MTVYIKKQKGLSLVEIMVASLIGMLIMAGVLQLYATSSRTEIVQQGTSRLQENARYLFARMAQDLSQTGYVGCFNFDPERIAVTLGDGVAAGGLFDFSQPVSVTNDDGLLNTDSLTFRYAQVGARLPLVARAERNDPVVVDDAHGNYGPLQTEQVVMVTDCSRAAIFMITNDPDTSGGVLQHDTGVVAADGQFNATTDLESTFGFTYDPDNPDQSDFPLGGSMAYIYAGTSGGHIYTIGEAQAAAAIGGGATCAAATPELCALFRDGQELAQGVEDLQIEVGWRDGVGNVRFGDADAAVDWDTVDRVRVTMIINSIDAVPLPTGNALSRQTFAKTFMLRNEVI